MSTQTQTQPSAPDPKPFGTLLTEAVRDVQSGLTALQTAEGHELAAGEQVAAAEAALTDARTAKAGAAAIKDSARTSLKAALTGLGDTVVTYRDSL